MLVLFLLSMAFAERSYKQKMKHLEKVAPIMLKLYFSDNRGEPESRANGRAAERIFTRFSANFAGKHEAMLRMWDACPEADLDMSLAREIDGRFAHSKYF